MLHKVSSLLSLTFYGKNVMNKELYIKTTPSEAISGLPVFQNLGCGTMQSSNNEHLMKIAAKSSAKFAIGKVFFKD